MRKTIITLVVALAGLVPAAAVANGMPPEAGSFRIVYLADPNDLRSIYADIAAFTRRYLQQA